MHLFFVDQYISLDMMAPIIHKLSKKNKVFLCNFNKIQSLKKIELYKFIIDQKNVSEVRDVIKFFSKENFYLVLINLLLLLPAPILKKGYRYWKYIWENVNFISRDLLIKFIKNNRIKTFSYDESLVEDKKKFIISISKELNIPLIMNHGGLYTLKTSKKKNVKFQECDFFLSPNKYPIYAHKLDKTYLCSGKYHQLGSPRFDNEWLNVLEKIHNRSKIINRKKIKIAFFVRPTSISYSETLNLLKNLDKIENIEVKLNYKPRDVWPTKCSSISKSEMQSSELIFWSDLVISYASSIILEGICRNKPLIYLDYLQIHKKNDTSWFDDFECIKKAKNSKHVIKLIMGFKKNRNKLNISKSNKKIILKNFITHKSGKGILSKYNSFYNSLNS